MWPFSKSEKAENLKETQVSKVKEQGEQEDLQELWKLFKDSPEDIQTRRKQVTSIIQENNSSSFPSEISVLTSIDELTGCFGLGYQLKNYYRYGEYSDCKRQREKFWFAIKNGSIMEGSDTYSINDETLMKPKELKRRQKIQEFYKKRLLEDKARGSSEDIWSERNEPLVNFLNK